MFVRFVLLWVCRFPLPLGVWEGLRVVIVALPGLFSYLFFFLSISTWQALQGAAITMKGQKLQAVHNVTYLGSTLSRVVHIDDEVNAWIAKAGRLRGSVWGRSEIRLDWILCGRLHA